MAEHMPGFLHETRSCCMFLKHSSFLVMRSQLEDYRLYKGRLLKLLRSCSTENNTLSFQDKIGPKIDMNADNPYF